MIGSKQDLETILKVNKGTPLELLKELEHTNYIIDLYDMGEIIHKYNHQANLQRLTTKYGVTPSVMSNNWYQFQLSLQRKK